MRFSGDGEPGENRTAFPAPVKPRQLHRFSEPTQDDCPVIVLFYSKPKKPYPNKCAWMMSHTCRSLIPLQTDATNPTRQSDCKPRAPLSDDQVEYIVALDRLGACSRGYATSTPMEAASIYCRAFALQTASASSRRNTPGAARPTSGCSSAIGSAAQTTRDYQMMFGTLNQAETHEARRLLGGVQRLKNAVREFKGTASAAQRQADTVG